MDHGPAGAITDATVMELASHFAAGDVIVDGGNSHFKDDVRRARVLAERGIIYLDAGTSGGVWGLERGYCLMIGGDAAAAKSLEPVFRTLAPGPSGVLPSPGKNSWRQCRAGLSSLRPGRGGTLRQDGAQRHRIRPDAGLCRGFRHSPQRRQRKPCRALNATTSTLADIAELWRRGSVVTSWLLDLSAAALARQPDLSGYSGFVQDSGEGRWTVQAAIDEAVPAEVLTAALYARFRSRQEHTFAEKMLSAMRAGFGGHVEPSKAE
jgi:6-phosphogluconate dehydrogenase